MKKVFFLLAITFALTLSATETATNDTGISIEQADLTENPMVLVAVETVAEITPITFVDVINIEANVETVTIDLVTRSDKYINKRYKLFKTPKSKLAYHNKQVKNYLSLSTNLGYRNS